MFILGSLAIVLLVLPLARPEVLLLLRLLPLRLLNWLLDGTARTIVLNRTYDFTDSQGSTTATGRKPWTCSPNPQLAINANNWCAADAAKVTITYRNTGTSGLPVGSNKTILGKGTSGWIKGKGLQLVGSKILIVQNIRISDINHQFVWGGDAIDLKGASNIWYFDTSTKVTISNNHFDGQSDYSTGCDKHHYWAFLMLGKGDQITFALNHVYYTARGPHIGGTSGNSPHQSSTKREPSYFNAISGHALDAEVGATVLAEENYFNNVKTPSTGNANGAVFSPTSSTMADQCSSTLGRKCALNTLAGSGSLTNTAKNGVISQFTASVVKSASMMDQSSVPSYVLANAGVGKVN
ncbi:hypothetical protein RSOLAG1IB_08036 [Rhizoctonia solani AG-1 IB]|uniref:pectin lyase n=1 Tax=Thanatephorus cucumeris (strain AG1-IB / isolate 7/3/14) TaxID=1108050 RepID=A0A0B7FGF3_THACB|nr:hypothetical protein RSOLAG1IB_08036 [Rhizoctonia solani AG-1 IB]